MCINTSLNVRFILQLDGIAPNDTQCSDFLLAHFESIKSNLNSYSERIAFEGMCLTQLQPTLNKQLKFKK